MQSLWAGTFFDGKTPTPHPVTIRLNPSGLEITVEGQASFFWPISEIRQTQGFYEGEQIRLERGGELSEALQIPDSSFLLELHRRIPGLNLRFHNPARRKMRIRLTVYAGIGAVIFSISIYLWGLPAATAIVAPHIPVSWEKQLGKVFFNELAPREDRCTDPRLSQAINHISSTLLASYPNQPYTFEIAVVDKPVVNALAAPGGYIIVYRGLLKDTQTPEELVGVLAHEFQHVLKRHSTKALLHHASTGILIAAVTGDTTGAMAYGLEIASTMGMLQYSRKNEREADQGGMDMIQRAGINPEGMIAFFESLQEKELESTDFLKYLSTHPPTEDRIQNLRSLAGLLKNNYINLFSQEEWKKIKNSCFSDKA